MKKYELTDEEIQFDGKTLFRIKAIRDFRNVKKGDLGGFVETEANLSHQGDCWVYDNAEIYDDALVCNNAAVDCECCICGHAIIAGHADIGGHSFIYGSVVIDDYMQIYDDAMIRYNDDLVYVSRVGALSDTITFFRNKNNRISLVCHRFIGHIEEFEKLIYEDYEGCKSEKEYMLAIELAKLRIRGEN